MMMMIPTVDCFGVVDRMQFLGGRATHSQEALITLLMFKTRKRKLKCFYCSFPTLTFLSPDETKARCAVCSHFLRCGAR